MHERFPRPRGDGPPYPVAGLGALGVPPPTRGWPLSPHIFL